MFLNFIHSEYNQTPNQVLLPNLMYSMEWLLVGFPPSIFLLFNNCFLSTTPHLRPPCIYYAIFRALSKLYSVLTFIPEEERLWGEPFPRSVHISFYHTSFMEFLLDKTRSEEYWLKDWHHFTALATKILHLFKDMYVMNGISRGMSFFSDDISCCERN